MNQFAKQRVERWNAQLIEKAERSLKAAWYRQDKAAIARLTEWLEDLRDREVDSDE